MQSLSGKRRNGENEGQKNKHAREAKASENPGKRNRRNENT